MKPAGSFEGDEWEAVPGSDFGPLLPMKHVGDRLGGIYQGTSKGKTQFRVQSFHRFRPARVIINGTSTDYEGIITVPGSWDLNEKLRRIPPNTKVRIKIVDMKNIGRKNPMPVFDVLVPKGTPIAAATPPDVEEEIPF